MKSLSGAKQSQSGLSRRAFLGVATAGAALGAAGLYIRAVVGEAEYASSSWPALDDRAAAVFQKLADLWLPAEAKDFPAWSAVPYMDAIADAWSHLPAAMADQVAAALNALEMASVVYGWHGAVLTQLSDDLLELRLK